jgi:hypothetical protein
MCDGATSDQVTDAVARDLATYGITYVPVEGDEYVYTVGLTGHGLPELLVDRQSRATDNRADYGSERLQLAFLKPIAQWAMRQDSLSPDSRMEPSDHETPVSYWVGFEEIDAELLRVPRAFYSVAIRAMRPRRWSLDTR